MAELMGEVPSSALAIYAHPDDPDVSAGGTLSAWASAGCLVHVCICADGDKGSSDPSVQPSRLIERRRKEVAAAGKSLGVAAHHWLEYRDGDLDNDLALRRRLVCLIRDLRPAAVVAADPTAVFFGQHYVNHRDHRAVGWATVDSVSPASANPHYFPDQGPPHRVGALYLSGTLEPDVWVDISSSIDQKISAVACHASQVGDRDEWLRTVVRQRAEEAGRKAGVQYAEEFRRVMLT
ncbi:MAG: PIG-L deacetylase family protein [Acidimicrobiales bacterium]